MKKLIASLIPLTLALGLFLVPNISQAGCEDHTDMGSQTFCFNVVNQALGDTQNIERELVDTIAGMRRSTSPLTADVDQNLIDVGPIGTDANDGDASDYQVELIRGRLLTPTEVACRDQWLACLDRIPDSDPYPIEASRDCGDDYNVCMRQAATRNAAIEAAQAQKDQATDSNDGDTSDSQLEVTRNMRTTDSDTTDNSQLETVRNMRPIDSGFYYNLRNAQFQTQEETIRNIRE